MSLKYQNNLLYHPSKTFCEKTSNQTCMFSHKPNKTQLFYYNWDIANDTYVPLPGPEEDADWLLAWWDYWEYYFSDIFLSSIPASGGHC